MMKITLIDAESSTHEEFASTLLPYGAKGYIQAFSSEECETELILTSFTHSTKGEYIYEDDLYDAADKLKMMKKGEQVSFTLQNGDTVLLVKE
jgi:hypothetical protein